MGFISYSVKFFNQKLNFYESNYAGNAPKTVVHEAKVLLKLLDDLRDEGYEDSYIYISSQCNAVNRLKNFIDSNNDVPFSLNKYTVDSNLLYGTNEYFLETYLSLIEQKMASPGLKISHVPDVFYDILEYSKDIFSSFNLDTAYCFLLRDTLLPYLAFRRWKKCASLNIYPLFISRKYFSFFDFEVNDGYVYSEIQNVIFDALEKNVDNFDGLREYIKSALSKDLAKFSKLFYSLKCMLNKISQKRILIVESGYIGTIPLLLNALDDRVDFKLFTTIPYFYGIYKNKFFTKSFEKIRLFETIQCQDALFKLSSYSTFNGEIKVIEALNSKVRQKSYAELRTWNKLINNLD